MTSLQKGREIVHITMDSTHMHSSSELFFGRNWPSIYSVHHRQIKAQLWDNYNEPLLSTDPGAKDEFIQTQLKFDLGLVSVDMSLSLLPLEYHALISFCSTGESSQPL